MTNTASITEGNGAKCETSIKYDNAERSAAWATARIGYKVLALSSAQHSPFIDKLCCQRPSDNTGHVIGEITDKLRIVPLRS